MQHSINVSPVNKSIAIASLERLIKFHQTNKQTETPEIYLTLWSKLTGTQYPNQA